MNGKKLPGVTPLNTVEVRAGQNHRLRVSLPGHSAITRTVRITPDEKKILEFNLTRSVSEKPKEKKTPALKSKLEVGSLKISAALAGTISIDGTPRGKAPISKLILPAGKHRIEFTNTAFGVTLIRKVVIEPGEISRIHFAPKKGMLSVNAQPWARVSIGKTISAVETPAQLELYEGTYSVLFICPNGKPVRVRAVVKAGKTEAISAACK